MAQRRVEIGEWVKIRHGRHKGKVGIVKAHERRRGLRYDSWDRKRNQISLLTYVVALDNVGLRRMPGSYLDLVG